MCLGVLEVPPPFLCTGGSILEGRITGIAVWFLNPEKIIKKWFGNYLSQTLIYKLCLFGIISNENELRYMIHGLCSLKGIRYNASSSGPLTIS